MDGGSLISRPVFLGVSIGTCSLAILTFAARICIRSRSSLRLQLDDYILLVAVAALIAAFTITNLSVNNVYYINAFLHGAAPFPSDFAAFMNTVWTYGATGNILCWVAMFAVKFSFLALFWPLIWPSRRLQILWWLSFTLYVPVLASRIFMPFVACPYSRVEVTYCALRPQFLARQADAIWWSVASDTATDLLIIAIPISLLWQTQLSLQQKLSVGIMLFLSAAMILIAIVRAVSARLHGTRDQVWDFFCIQLEANVAVVMVSLTAFRQLFVAMKNERSDRVADAARVRVRVRGYGSFRLRTLKADEEEEEATGRLARPRDGLEHFLFVNHVPRNQRAWYGHSRTELRSDQAQARNDIESLQIEHHDATIGRAF